MYKYNRRRFTSDGSPIFFGSGAAAVQDLSFIEAFFMMSEKRMEKRRRREKQNAAAGMHFPFDIY